MIPRGELHGDLFFTTDTELSTQVQSPFLLLSRLYRSPDLLMNACFVCVTTNRLKNEREIMVLFN